MVDCGPTFPGCRAYNAINVVDPYPRMTLEYALKALKVRFGAGNVVRGQGQVSVNVQVPDRQQSISLTLTIEQAKFLAANPISLKDLMDEKYPPNWPAEALSK